MRSDFGQGAIDALPELTAACCSQFRVGAVSVRVAGRNHADVTLVPSLMPFRDASAIPDITIQLERVQGLPHSPNRELFDSGSVWRLFEDECGFQFDFSTPFFGATPYKRLMVDRKFREATLLLRNDCFADRTSAAPLDYPLDEVLITHRLTQEDAIELHGCGIVGPDGKGNLFVGHSGAGKSTTARLWTSSQDVEILSDDRIIVRIEETSTGSALRQNIRRQLGSVVDASGLPQGRAAEVCMYGTPWHGEAAYASPASAPLKRICILQHGRGNRLTRLAPAPAVAELFARAFVPFHQHQYVDRALVFLQKLVEMIPCYRYAFEPDQGAVEAILDLRD